MNAPMLEPHRLSVRDFRDLELNAPEDERWELIDGRIVRSMAGGTKIHNLIVFNAQTALMNALRQKKSPCRAFAENVRLDIDKLRVSTLPDVVVSCTPWKDGPTTLRDAIAIVEVLSPSTAIFDLEQKLSAYFTLDSLRTTVFVEQQRTRVILYEKSEDAWLRRDLTDAEDRIHFAGIDVKVSLQELYEDVAAARSASV